MRQRNLFRPMVQKVKWSDLLIMPRRRTYVLVNFQGDVTEEVADELPAVAVLLAIAVPPLAFEVPLASEGDPLELPVGLVVLPELVPSPSVLPDDLQ